MSILAMSIVIPKWHFAVMVWMILGALPPLVAYYRKHNWRIPWWHFPFAIGHIAVTLKLAHDYTWGCINAWLYWEHISVTVWDLARDSLLDLVVYSAWLGVPIFVASAWLTARLNADHSPG